MVYTNEEVGHAPNSKYRESLDRFEKSKTLTLCLKNAFREFYSKILFRLSKNLTSSRNSQKTKIHLFTSLNMQQEAISQKEMVFRFRKDIQSEKGWRFDILYVRSPGVKGICADALLCDSLSCQSLRFVEARYSTEPIQ